MDDYKKIQQDLIKRRVNLGLSQQEVADLMGVHLNTVSRWERGSITLKKCQDLNELYRDLEETRAYRSFEA